MKLNYTEEEKHNNSSIIFILNYLMVSGFVVSSKEDNEIFTLYDLSLEDDDTSLCELVCRKTKILAKDPIYISYRLTLKKSNFNLLYSEEHSNHWVKKEIDLFLKKEKNKEVNF